MAVVTEEPKGVEGNLQNLQQNRQLVDVAAQTKQSLDNSNTITKAIENINTQQDVTSMISQYIADPANSNRVVPSSLGLDDPNLTSLLNRYNEVILKKEKEAPNVAPKSTVMQDLNSQATNLKSSILENLNTVNKNLRLQEGNLAQQNRQNTGFLSAVPRNERAMQEIKRKQDITEGLYLYLLQKREEAAISRTSANVTNYAQIDPASGYGPVDPNKRNIIMYTTLLGIFIAFGYVYLKGLLNDKINSSNELLQRTAVPVLGSINYIPKFNNQALAVSGNGAVAEQFRALRTEISLLLKENAGKTVVVTSAGRGEGKSFVSLNLAAICAAAGKRVALIEFDLRQPGIHNNLGVENTVGIGDFLSGKVANPASLKHELANVPGLHFFNSGPVPPSAADLLLSDHLNKFFGYLQQEDYDYIIIDSPSAGVVSDAFVLSEYGDINLFVTRNGLTSTAELDVINEITNAGKFGQMAIVLNAIKSGENNSYSA